MSMLNPQDYINPCHGLLVWASLCHIRKVNAAIKWPYMENQLQQRVRCTRLILVN